MKIIKDGINLKNKIYYGKCSYCRLELEFDGLEANEKGTISATIDCPNCHEPICGYEIKKDDKSDVKAIVI